jgi:hypothetical protein
MLLENIEQVGKVINVSASVGYDHLFPHLFSAEQKYIHYLLGEAMYNKLLEFSNNPDSNILERADMNPDFSDDFYIKVPDAEMAFARVLFLAQRSLAHLAYYEGFPLLSIFVSDAGFHRSEAETMKPLFKYQEDAIRLYYHNNGMNGLDMMLKVLEVNIEHFPEFVEQNKLLHTVIFPSTSDFNAIISIRDSRIIFMRLQQSINTVCELNIAAILGTTNYATFMEGMLADEKPAKVTAILPHIQRVAAYLATTMLMEETGAELTERGLYFEGVKGGLSMNDVKMPSADNRIIALIRRNKEISEQYIARLQKHMAENTADWGSYTNPRTYIHSRDNAGKKTYWV